MPDFTNQDLINQWSKVPEEFIDEYGEEGDFSKKYLLNPTIFRLLGDIKGKKVLEVGFGTGYLCRLMAKRGAKVTGVEPAEKLFRGALKKEAQEKLGITYLQKDLSLMDEFSEEFDSIVANMVFLDIPDYKQAIKNCIKSIKNGGTFIFSIWHPCFFESIDWSKQKYIKIDEYFKEYSVPAKFGSSFHRTLSSYLNLVIKEGGKIVELVEPQLPENLAKEYPDRARDLHVPSFLVVKVIKI